MTFIVKTFTRDGECYPSTVAYQQQADARAEYDRQRVSGRFVRAELWSGTGSGQFNIQASKVDWTDGTLIASKP